MSASSPDQPTNLPRDAIRAKISPFGPNPSHVMPKSLPPQTAETSSSSSPPPTAILPASAGAEKKETMVDGTTNGMGVKTSAEGGVRSGKGIGGKGKERQREDDLQIRLEFGGGIHLLFNKQPRYTIYLPKYLPSSPSGGSNAGVDANAMKGEDDKKSTDMRYLIKWMKEELLSERVEMFGDGEGVRPGILVLINDTDWELEGELDYVLEDKDEVVFISTLHGG